MDLAARKLATAFARERASGHLNVIFPQGRIVQGVGAADAGLASSAARVSYIAAHPAPIDAPSNQPPTASYWPSADSDLLERPTIMFRPSAPLLYPVQCASDDNFCTTNFGNLGRNIYRGPFQQNWDFSLLKDFRLSERQSIRFTADFFNIWNHANFGNPSITDIEAYLANPGDPNNSFGKIFSTVGTPRLIQFSLRWSF